MRSILVAALLASGVEATNNQRDCIANTGAFCAASCAGWRGPAYCKWTRCFCESGACAGADEICHTGESRQMNESADGAPFRIRNARWTDFFLYASTHGPLTARRDVSRNPQFQFNLREPPALYDASRSPTFLIFSVKWPDAVLFILQKTACQTTSFSEGDTQSLGMSNASNMTVEELENFALDPENENLTLPAGWTYDEEPEDLAALTAAGISVDDPENLPQAGPERRLASRRRSPSRRRSTTHCEEVKYPQTRYVQGAQYGLGADPPMWWLLTKIERAPLVHQSPGYQLVMFKNSLDSYLYMPLYGIYGFAGWGTRAQREDPGAGGYWYFDPPLPAELWDRLPTYTGRTCSAFCGNLGDIVYTDDAVSTRLGSIMALSLSLAVLTIVLGPHT